jgi:carbamoyl-phosphate synthase large subunit
VVINTPSGKRSKSDGSFIRRSAIRHKVPYITTITAAQASVTGIAAQKNVSELETLKSLQEYHQNMK